MSKYKPPNISFLVCTRNRAETILECVLNLLNSGRSDIEVVVRDNSSEDNTFELLSHIHDKRFKLYKASENEGTRNFFEISKLATGQIVTWLSDEDDFQFDNLDYIISQFQNSEHSVLLGSIIVGKRHEVIFPEAVITDPVCANLKLLRFSGCGGVFVRKIMLESLHKLKILNDDDGYMLWNYYPIGFFATFCLKDILFTTSRVVVKQSRFCATNNNWSISKPKITKKLPHYYPESVFDRLSSNIVDVSHKNIKLQYKIRIIIKLIKSFCIQANSYLKPSFILLLKENYDLVIVHNYIAHINNLKLNNVFFRAWYLIKKIVDLINSVHSTSNYFCILREK